MRYLPRASARYQQLPLATIASLVLMMIILPEASAAASITHTYGVSMGFVSDTYGDVREEVPIAGFDSSLGHFNAATVNLTLNATVDVSYACNESGECGTWKQDPEMNNPEMIWEPDPYPHDLHWSLQAEGWVFPDLSLPDWRSGPNAQVSNTGYEYSEAPDQSGYEHYTYYQVLMSTLTSSDSVFVTDDELIYLMLGSLSLGSEGWGNYRMITGFNADAAISIRYDYQPAAQPVPEPNFNVVTFLALISLALMTKLISPKRHS